MRTLEQIYYDINNEGKNMNEFYRRIEGIKNSIELPLVIISSENLV